MPITATYTPAQSKLTVLGTVDPEEIIVSRTALGALRVNSGAIPITGGSPTTINTSLIEVFGDAGNDTITISESSGAMPAAELHGDAGNDRLTGGSDADELFGEADHDQLFGRGGIDLLYGGSGDDILDGGAGADVMAGQAGNDLYHVDNADDEVIETAGNGTLDRIFASVSYTMAAGVQVERLQTADDAATTEIDLTGNALANVILGNAGNNTLDGGGGADTMNGQGGNDSYVVDNAADVVVEGEGGGEDRIYTNIDYTLAAGARVEILATNGYFNDVAVNLTGNEFANTLAGNIGDNVLDGGLGADRLNGGGGDDWFYVDNPGDTVSEAPDEGSDRVFTTISYTLAEFTHVELLAALNAAGTASLNLTGSTYANSIYGNAGDNVIDGMGGADVMGGLGGNDRYYVDDAGDAVIEAAGAGALDRVFASVSYTLTAGAEIEVFATVDDAATTAIDLTGNELANLILGNAGENTLDGKAGADIMNGQGGDDTYVVDNAADQVVEGANGGNDIVFTNVNYTLASGARIETLATDGYFIDIPVSLTGNEFVNTISGNIGDNVLNGGIGADVLGGGDGNDWYYVDNAFDAVSETIGQGTDDRVFASVSYELGLNAEIEVLAAINAAANNAINLTGNVFSSSITGNAGDNIIDGRGGADTMSGLGGNDWYYVDSADDVVIEGAGGGTLDRIFARVSYTLGAGVEVERFATADAAATTAIDLTGNAFANVISGNAGENRLDGLGGADTMSGLGGDDDYVVDSALDVVFEAAGEGSDRVLASVSYTLGATRSIETLNTIDNGATTAINLTGNELVNALAGNAGANTLDGGGGADTLRGFGGNDWYIVDNAAEVVIESLSGGTDRVFASVSYTLGAGRYVETLSTTNSAGTAAISLTGNEVVNAVYGNAGANTLDGGVGGDTLSGLGGNDYYFVDNAADVVIESASGGTDRVFTSVSFTLGAGAQVETLSTTDNAGVGALNLVGNELANALIGNAGNNLLDGRAGADTLSGLGGDDWYILDNAADVVNETTGNGTDRVFASVSYTLGAGRHVETLSTTDSGASTALNLTGNELDNALYGNAGANVLDGKGGADTLVGLLGADTFAFTTALGGGNVDAITGYAVADDTIQLENAVFTGLAAGGLTAGAFNTGPAATQADDRIVYNSTTGALLFDIDGVGGVAGVQFATLSTGLALTSADFVVV